MKRGYGVSAMINPAHVAPLAKAAEEAGHQTFWVNDISEANGLEQLARAQATTSTIRLGVGVLPVDRWDAQSIATAVRTNKLDPARLLIGIGAGNMHKGSLVAVQDVADGLRALTTSKVLVGALGPKMCALGGSHANGVLLNWLTPASITDLGGLTRTASLHPTEVIAYVRTAVDPAARARLEAEASSYEGYPSYKRHFDRMGVRAIDTTIFGDSDAITARFEAYGPVANEIVARAIAADDSLAAYLDVLHVASGQGA